MKKAICILFSACLLIGICPSVLAAPSQPTTSTTTEALIELANSPNLLDQQIIVYSAEDIAKREFNDQLRQLGLLSIDSFGHLIIDSSAWNIFEDHTLLNKLASDYLFANSSIDDGILAVDPNTLELYSCDISSSSLEKMKTNDVLRSLNISSASEELLSPRAGSHCSYRKVGFGTIVRSNRAVISDYYNNLVELAASNPRVTPGATTVQYWIGKVQPNGLWDYKTTAAYGPYNQIHCLTYGINDVKVNKHKTAEFMGNYNYAFTGRQLFSLSILKFGSNAAAGNPFRPDTDDYPAIEEGYEDASV